MNGNTKRGQEIKLEEKIKKQRQKSETEKYDPKKTTTNKTDNLKKFPGQK